MNIEHWFATPLWFDTLDDIDNKGIAKYAKALSKRDNGRVLSNYGGWQSNDFHLDSCENNSLKHLGEIVESKIREACTQINLKSNMSAFLSNFWININKKGDGNNVHTHPACSMAAVYYVQVAKNAESNIVFHHPNNLMNFWWQSFTDNNTYTTFNTINVTPEEGRLVIFPPWLSHHVNPNQSTTERISVAFNCDISFV